ncbi:hypothetical protein LTR85_000804 [Meristemomyces frigidus]|nr:hypothetical protein LTR85_000804 [Meristemomyces frigidus]
MTHSPPTLASADNASASRGPANLLTIPPELRDQILDYLLVNHTAVVEPSRSTYYRGNITKDALRHYEALQLTCRQLRHETRSLFFARNVIAVWALGGLSKEMAALQPILEHIRHLALYRFVAPDLVGQVGESRTFGCVLHIRLPASGGVEWCVRVGTDEDCVLERGLYEGSASESTETEKTKRLAEALIEPAVERLRAALDLSGKLEPAMLVGIYEAVEEAWLAGDEDE